MEGPQKGCGALRGKGGSVGVGSEAKHRLLLSRPTCLIVRAYLLLTRVFAMLSVGPFQPKRYICFSRKNKVCQVNAVHVGVSAD